MSNKNISSYKNKSQIMAFPRGINTNKNEIKDNINFQKKKAIIYLYKMLHDYDLDIDYNKSIRILQGYNIKGFPINEKYII